MTRRPNLLAALVLCASSALCTGCHGSPPELKDPSPMSIPANVSPEKTADAIKQALKTHGWTLEGEAPDHLNAMVLVRGATARIDIDYDEKQVAIRYKSSDNLDYGYRADGKPTIHARYLTWIKQLGDDIQRNLSLSR